MTPSERWPAILLHLEPDTWKRASDLAQALGVSERTVYRDVQSMIDAGVPLQGVPGKGYRVPEDYLLSPVTFTVDEAVMLVLGSAYAVQNFDGRHRAAARSAQHKLEHVMPADARKRAVSVQGHVSLVPPSVFGPSTDDLLPRVRRALVEERTLEATVASDGATKVRRLDPYGLVKKGTSWHVVGHDHGRNRVVHLRLQQVDAMTLTDRTFDRPDSYRSASDPAEATGSQSVRLLFSADVAPSVQVAPSMEVTDRTHTSDDRLLLTLRVDHELEVLPWVLSWGRHVRVVEPPGLRKRLATEAQAVADQYGDPPTLLT